MIKKLLITIFLFSACLSNAQSNLELAEKYLKERGELAFTFTANTIKEIQQLANIVSFDHGQDPKHPLTIKAIANKDDFEKFLKFNLPFTINKELNEPKNVEMFNPKIHKKGVSGKNASYTLSFPLVAYPTYAQYVQQMNDFVNDHSDIARLVSIGTTSGSGSSGYSGGAHQLLFIVLSDNVNTREKEPRVMYTSSIHGDEIAGYPSMLNLIDHFITAYKNTGDSDHTRVKNLLDNSEVWINPLANPDGTYRTSNTSVSSAIRGNAYAFDMNRNYPVPDGTLHPDGRVYQYETTKFMELAESTHFVVAGNFHGGEEVVNYPWDYTYDRHADDTWMQLVSTEYAANTHTSAGSVSYMTYDNTFNSYLGITHGADWYIINGGRQDYMNYERHTKEITFEISNTKLPPASPSGSYDILDLWNYNKEAFIEFLIQGTYGFQGVVKDANTNLPINAKISILNHDTNGSWVETELPLGDYYRPIKGGTYDIMYEADCYVPYILRNQTITDYQTVVLPDVYLTPLSTASSPSNLRAYSLKMTSATISWDNIKNASLYNIRYRKVGASSWITTTSTTNSTNLTGLTATSTYEFQVTATCSGTTTSWSAIETFNTITTNYCTSQGSDSAGGYIGLVKIGNIDMVSSATGYSDLTNLALNVDKGEIVNTSIMPIWPNNSGTKYNDAYSIWIDFNQDGDFLDANEQVWSKKSSKTRPVTGSFTIPSSAVYGTTRMRVSMKYYNNSNQSAPTACETFSYGEVEDYTVNIVDKTLGIEDEILSTFSIYPNPVSNGEITIKMPNEIHDFDITVSNVLGQKVYTKNVQNNFDTTELINTANFMSGIYFITVSTDLGKATKKLIIN
ncbi:M14 family zinc carboxypeptidase [Lutibacter maritimus]|uniref:Por secretion system C-terminal sorting domain-containing protein n=1 Tax=Lutibacter maritimus TaxID=593133 RepID=A0A1I6PMR4_9FLAO|nr:M14 family zinc carboxypeptidase [Lutibacter maritimus]SFS41420.1 Por secretion system C-terminal sorting domain-containing protein [Lutibacter maritimus]